MPPKKPTADPPAPSSSDVPQKEKKTDGDDGASKVASHPSTAIMMKEALGALDSGKGVSSQAVQTYIKQKYPSVDAVRLKHLVRNALKKGMETGTLVRPVKSKVTTGALGKFRLAPKVKQGKSKTENVDPNLLKEPKATKEGAKRPKKAGATKKTGAAEAEAKSQEDSNPPKKSKKEKDATSKVAPAKKPKSKTTESEDDEGVSVSAKPKAGKKPKRKTTESEDDEGVSASAKPKAGKKPKGKTTESEDEEGVSASAKPKAGKKPKGKTTESEDEEGVSASAKPKAGKKPKGNTTESEDDEGVSASAKAGNEAKSGAASKSKTVKAGSKAPVSKARGRWVKTVA